MTYDPTKNAQGSYDVAIDAMREVRKREQELLLYGQCTTIGDATLYLGDAREIVPHLTIVQSMITDPPYGIDGGRGGDSKKFGKGAYEGDWDDTEDYIAFDVVRVVELCLQKCNWAAITPGTRCLHMYPRPRDIGCFWTPASVTHGPWGFTNFQPILFYGNDFRAGRGALPSGKALTEIAEKNGHPCPKPIGAMKWLVEKTSRPNDIVLDPFMGSGTTGVACVNLGRKFIGIEWQRKYFDIACKRIEEAHAQPRLFKDEPPKQKQEELL